MRRLLMLTWLGLTPLAGCGSPAPQTMAHYRPVSHWVGVLRGPDAMQRKQAVRILGNVGTADPAVIPALAGAVKDADAAVRSEAVLALLKIGPPARDAVPALTDALRDKDARVRGYAAKAVERINGPALRP
jgi:HEAT repeat protein